MMKAILTFNSLALHVFHFIEESCGETKFKILQQCKKHILSTNNVTHYLSVPQEMFWACYHNCTTFTKPIQLLKKEFVSAFYVSTLSTNEKSSHRAAAGRKWKNKFRKSVRAVVFNPSCVSIYNLSMDNSGIF